DAEGARGCFAGRDRDHVAATGAEVQWRKEEAGARRIGDHLDFVGLRYERRRQVGVADFDLDRFRHRSLPRPDFEGDWLQGQDAPILLDLAGATAPVVVAEVAVITAFARLQCSIAANGIGSDEWPEGRMRPAANRDRPYSHVAGGVYHRD